MRTHVTVAPRGLCSSKGAAFSLELRLQRIDEDTQGAAHRTQSGLATSFRMHSATHSDFEIGRGGGGDPRGKGPSTGKS
eukprot:2613277-Pyramimonas_sp.AAC.1